MAVQLAQGLVIVADEVAFASDDFPLLVIDTVDPGMRSFRVVASEAWGPIANLPIANMDWEDFADHVDPDGVHRGF
ncbi:MAG: hypothetical protein AAF663_09115 [Planctomycetota bacterium]